MLHAPRLTSRGFSQHLLRALETLPVGSVLSGQPGWTLLREPQHFQIDPRKGAVLERPEPAHQMHPCSAQPLVGFTKIQALFPLVFQLPGGGGSNDHLWGSLSSEGHYQGNGATRKRPGGQIESPVKLQEAGHWPQEPQKRRLAGCALGPPRNAAGGGASSLPSPSLLETAHR